MTYKFTLLNDEIRLLMQDELVTDISKGQLYKSSRFNSRGLKKWEEFLSEAIADYDEDWLTAKLKAQNVFKEFENRQTGKARVPINAAETLSQTEFNRFYMRAVCRNAIEKKEQIIVYRAKQSASTRSDSDSKIGMVFDPDSLLSDLRANKNVELLLGIARPNSGLSIKINE